MPVNQKRVDEVAKLWRYSCGSNETFFSSLPEFQIREWIPCTDRMPNIGQAIWSFDPRRKGEYPGFYIHEVGLLQDYEFWMPCQVPAPPVEEESELVQALRKRLQGCSAVQGNDVSNAYKDAIEIVKRHEREKKAGGK